MEPQTKTQKTITTIKRVIFFFCAAMVLGGCLVLVGWAIDNEFLKSIFPGLGEMNPRTALAFVIGGIAVIATGAPRYRPYLLSAASIIFAFGFFRLYGDAVNIYYDNEYSTTILVVALTLVFLILIGNTYIRLNRLKEGNQKLERQAKENAKKLNQTTKQLNVKQKELKEKAKQVESSKRVTKTLQENLYISKNEIEADQSRDQAVFESVAEGIFAVDDRGVIMLFNPMAEHITGFTSLEAIGVHYTKILQFENERTGVPSNHFITEALLGKKVETVGQTVLVTKNGDRIPITQSSAPIIHKNGKIAGAVVIFRDLSKEYEVDRAKTEFVSLASHQLRTPLSAMKWHIKMLLKGDLGNLSSDQKEFLQVIDDSNERMISLINSFLDVSRIESGKIVIDPKPTNLKSVVETLVEELKPELDAKLIDCTIKFGTIPEITTDPLLVRQVFLNLISNAIKYSPREGKIEVSAKRDPGRENIVVEVRDTGYGIPVADRHHVFEKFYRSANTKKYETESTGLGLYFVKAVVETLGGTIWFESEEGHGTTFSFTLPISGATVGPAKTAKIISETVPDSPTENHIEKPWPEPTATIRDPAETVRVQAGIAADITSQESADKATVQTERPTQESEFAKISAQEPKNTV